MSDSARFGYEEISKIRHLLGGLAILSIEFEGILKNVFDEESSKILYENHKEILEEITIWFTEPERSLRNVEYSEKVIYTLKTILKRFINKNSANGILLNIENNGLVLKFGKKLTKNEE